jgi:hypothetical protein
MRVRSLPGDNSKAAVEARLVTRANRTAGLAALKLAFRYDPGVDRIVSCKVWVLSPDGKARVRYGLDDFTDTVAAYGSYFWVQERVLEFNPAGKVAVGEVLAWQLEYEQERADLNYPYFTFLESLPCLKAEFEAVPCEGGRLIWSATSSSIAAPEPGSEPGALRWRAENIEPLPKELPSGFIPNPDEILVQCIPAGASPTGPTWPGVAAQCARLLEPAVSVDPSIATQARALVAGKTGRWARIRALAEFVQRDIVYLAIQLDDDALAGYRPHPAPEVLRNRYGDCKDKAALLIALLREIGESGRFVLLNSGSPAATNQAWPSPDFNHAIVAIPADLDVPTSWPTIQVEGVGREVLFDPTNPVAPLGVLPAEDQGGYGLLIDSGRGRLFRFPRGSPAANSIRTTAAGTLDGDGVLKARIDRILSGLAATDFYFGTRFGRSTDEFENAVGGLVRDTNSTCADLHWSDQWDPAAAKYKLGLDFTVPGHGRQVGDGLMLVSPDLLPPKEKLAPWTGALDGVVWFSAMQFDTATRITIPPGYVVDELPDPWRQQVPTSSAEISFRVDGNAVLVSSHLERQAGFYERADYEALRALYDGLRDAARGPVVLRRVSAGNP